MTRKEHLEGRIRFLREQIRKWDKRLHAASVTVLTSEAGSGTCRRYRRELVECVMRRGDMGTDLHLAKSELIDIGGKVPAEDTNVA